jgi:seryl-tRNA synthetase
MADFECLVVAIGRLKAMILNNQAKTGAEIKTIQEKMDTIQGKNDANQEEMKEEIKSGEAEMKATVNAILQKMKSWREETKAYTEKQEANPEGMRSAAEHPEVPKEEAAVKIVRALKKRYGDWNLAVRCCRQPQKQTQDNGGSQKRLATGCREMTHHAGVAWLKEHGHTGPTVEQRGRKSEPGTILQREP